MTTGALRALACLAAATVSFWSRAADFSSAGVVLPGDASESQRYAAEELCRYVGKSVGRALRICGEGDAPAGRLVRIETAAPGLGLGADGFSVSVEDGDLVVRGSRERGCLYGVYELVERFLGVRWYAPDFEAVPKLAAFEVPDGFSASETPDFDIRETYWYGVIGNHDFASKLRLTALDGGTGAKYGGDKLRFGKGLGSCHTFESLLPVEEHFDAHPEYFSMVDGERIRERTQLCLTNPEVLAIVTSNVLKRVRADPGADIYGVSQNDWYGYCTCPRCKAVDEEEGSHMGTVLRFVNAVAEAVEGEFPKALVQTLAYQYTRTPPAVTRPRRNVVVCLATFECDCSHPIATGVTMQNASFRDDLGKWFERTDRIFIWDYVTNFSHYPGTFPNWGSLQANLRFFRDNGVKMVFSQGAWQGAGGDFADLKAWLLAKYMWKVDRDEKALLDDFFDGFYGSASRTVRADFEEAKRHFAEHPMAMLQHSDGLRLVALPDSYFDRALKRRRTALAAAERDAAHARNIRKWAFSVAYTRLFRTYVKHKLGVPLSSGERALAGELARDVDAHCRAEKNIRFSEFPYNCERLVAFLKEAVEW